MSVENRISHDNQMRESGYWNKWRISSPEHIPPKLSPEVSFLPSHVGQIPVNTYISNAL